MDQPKSDQVQHQGTRESSEPLVRVKSEGDNESSYSDCENSMSSLNIPVEDEPLVSDGHPSTGWVKVEVAEESSRNDCQNHIVLVKIEEEDGAERDPLDLLNHRKDPQEFDEGARFDSSASENEAITKTQGLCLHRSIHTAEDLGPCTECEKSIGQRLDLYTHQMLHTGEGPYECTELGRNSWPTSQIMDNHSSHTEDGQLAECEQSFINSSHLRRHQRMHPGAEPYLGMQNSNSSWPIYQPPGTRSRHGLDFPPQRKRKKRFSEEELNILVEQVSTDHDKLFGKSAMKVPERTKKAIWVRIQSMVNAVGITHRTVDEIQKRWYDIRRRTKEKIFANISESAGTGGGPSQHLPLPNADSRVVTTLATEAGQGLAGVDTSAVALLKQHSETEENEAIIKTKGLCIHRRLHTGEEMGPCRDCEKTPGQRLDLYAHQMVHTGEEPYDCTDPGGSSWPTSQLMDNHRPHTGDGQFAECEKSFINSSHLRRHQGMHPGEEPYEDTEQSRNSWSSYQTTEIGSQYGAESPQQRKRKKRFSEEELSILVEEVTRNYNRLFGKAAMKVPESAKKAIWVRIQSRVNAVGITHRTVDEIQRRWYDTRRRTKEKIFINISEEEGTEAGLGQPMPLTHAESLGETAVSPEAGHVLVGIDTSTVKLMEHHSETEDQGSSGVAEADVLEKAATQYMWDITPSTSSALPGIQAAPFEDAASTSGTVFSTTPAQRRARQKAPMHPVPPDAKSTIDQVRVLEYSMLQVQQKQLRAINSMGRELRDMGSSVAGACASMQGTLQKISQGIDTIAQAMVKLVEGHTVKNTVAKQQLNNRTMLRSVGRLANATTLLSRSTVAMHKDMVKCNTDLTRGLVQVNSAIGEMATATPQMREAPTPPPHREELRAASSASAVHVPAARPVTRRRDEPGESGAPTPRKKGKH
ncbi:hypothetical protein NDU88_000023 [Pleurodeles waltl]|uniref:C2H2-type domain-containing protein n=2 Tax=Pleurodeles waltl TaxID=8319 RepID=A0AAV7KLD1_PLEWA|nr:hypothetical protein NDU88_000023 [Pleurodeles waltl]